MIRSLQGEGEANEVEVGDEASVEDYAQYAEGLLKDDAMLFITLTSASAAQVPKVLQVVEQTKRLRHISGTFSILISLLSSYRTCINRMHG